MFFKHENNYNHIKLHIVIALSAVAAITSLTSLIFGGIGGKSTEAQVINALIKMESLKAGGIENRDKLQQLYTNEAFKKQQTQAIDQALTRLGGAPEPAQPEQNVLKTFTPEQITAIKANAYIEGNKDAKFLIVEYTDPECPFCIRQFKDNTIKTVMEGRTDVGHIVKVVQGVNHANTEYKSLATICAGQLKGESAYYTMFSEMLGTIELATNEQVYGFADKLGIKKDALSACMASPEAKGIYTAYRQEAMGIGATGTPGNVIINTENGNYVHLAGAYPAGQFTEALSKL